MYTTFIIVEMDAQSQSNVEEKVKSLMSEDDESADDIQNDQREKQNTWVTPFYSFAQFEQWLL